MNDFDDSCNDFSYQSEEEIQKLKQRIKNIAARNNLFFKISETDSEMIINNTISLLGISDKNITNEQKGAIAFNLGMLEARKIFLSNEKFINLIESLHKIPHGQKKLFPDFNIVKDVIRNHPDLCLADKIILLKKLSTNPSINTNDAVIYLIDREYQSSKMNEITALAEKYFVDLDGERKIPYQFISVTGDFSYASGLASIPGGMCKGYFIYRSVAFEITDAIIEKLNHDKNFVRTFYSLGINRTINITDEFIRKIGNDKPKLKNVLLSLKGKEFKNMEDFDKLISNLMPAISKSDQDDKNWLFNFLDKLFLDSILNRIKNIEFPTPDSFEKALIETIPSIVQNSSIITIFKEYSVISFNSLSIDVIPEQNEYFDPEDLKINITNYTNPDQINICPQIKMELGDIKMDFDLTNKGIELKDAVYVETPIDLFIDDHKYVELEEMGIIIPENLTGNNIVIDKDNFANQTLYINIINPVLGENHVHFSSNYTLDNNYSAVCKTKYEPNKFIMSEQESKIFLEEYSIELGMFLALLRKNEVIKGFEINTGDNAEKNLFQLTRLYYDRKQTQRIIINSYVNDPVDPKIHYNMPSMPPYLAVQIKTNPILEFLASISYPDIMNLSILRSLNLFKTIINLYMKSSGPLERNNILKKDINIDLHNQKLENINLFKIFDVISKVNYSNQLK